MADFWWPAVRGKWRSLLHRIGWAWKWECRERNGKFLQFLLHPANCWCKTWSSFRIYVSWCVELLSYLDWETKSASQRSLCSLCYIFDFRRSVIGPPDPSDFWTVAVLWPRHNDDCSCQQERVRFSHWPRHSPERHVGRLPLINIPEEDTTVQTVSCSVRSLFCVVILILAYTHGKTSALFKWVWT